MFSRLAVVVVATFILLAEPLAAWNAAGHMIVAAEAYRHLTIAQQKRVQTLLRKHPAFGYWAAMHHTAAATTDFYTYIVMRSGTWPDEIRGYKSGYDRPKWHFIDYPLRPPKFTFEPTPKDSIDILDAIDSCQRVLKSVSSGDTAKAVALSWLVHLVADIHQPLHCSSYFDTNFPDGDRGGNSIGLDLPGGVHKSLHQFWDRAIRDSGYADQDLAAAALIESKYPKSKLKELSSATTPLQWSKTSRLLAISTVYEKGSLPKALHNGKIPPLSEAYVNDAHATSERQAALAGWRLAKMLGVVVKP